MAPKAGNRRGGGKMAKKNTTKAGPSQTASDKPYPSSDVWQPGQRTSEKHGNLVSHTNPYQLPGKNADGTPRINDNFETMPTPEIWHSQMSNRFPFGETPYMERYLSNQINKDLKMNDKILEMPTSRPFDQLSRAEKLRLGDGTRAYEPPEKEKSMWALPEVKDDAVIEAIALLMPKGTKRPSVVAESSRSSKRIKEATQA